MNRFPRFFTHRALLLARNDGSIRAPIITENDGFFISRRYAIPEYPTGVFGAITAGRGDDFSGLSLFMAIQTHTLSLLRKTKDHNNSSTSSTGIFLHYVRNETQNVCSIPRILDLS